MHKYSFVNSFCKFSAISADRGRTLGGFLGRFRKVHKKRCRLRLFKRIFLERFNKMCFFETYKNAQKKKRGIYS